MPICLLVELSRSKCGRWYVAFTSREGIERSVVMLACPKSCMTHITVRSETWELGVLCRTQTVDVTEILWLRGRGLYRSSR